MKKLIALLGMVVLAVLAISPKLVGLVIRDGSSQANLMELTGQTNLSLPLQSGWFSSAGKLTITDPVIAGTRYDGVQIDADLDLMHGPLLVTNEGIRVGLAWASTVPTITGLAANDPLQKIFAQDMQTTMTVLAQLNGSVVVQMHAGPLDFSRSEMQLTLNDLSATLNIARSGRAELSLASAQVNVANPAYLPNAFSTTLHNAELKFASEDISVAPLPGSLSIKIEELQNNRPQMLTMRGISINYVARSNPETQTVTVQQELQIDSILSESVESLTLSTEISGIDAAVVADYVNSLREAQARIRRMNDLELEVFMEQRGEVLALGLLRKPLQQHSTLVMQAYGGAHRTELDISWPGVPSLQSIDQLGFSQVLRLLTADLHIVANEEALGRSPLGAAVQAYRQQGMLPQDEDGNVLLNASLSDSTLILNEQRFPLQPFLDMQIGIP